jgi:hypothetical protein
VRRGHCTVPATALAERFVAAVPDLRRLVLDALEDPQRQFARGLALERQRHVELDGALRTVMHFGHDKIENVKPLSFANSSHAVQAVSVVLSITFI